MKTIAILSLLSAVLVPTPFAQVVTQDAASSQASDPLRAPPGLLASRVLRYETGERGPHHSIWHKVVETTNARGQLQVSTNQAYVELSSGLNYMDVTGQWTLSSDQIEPFAQGAVARHGQHQVIFANNLNTIGAIDMQTPDNKRLRSNLIGLMYCDTTTGKAVLIARLRDSEGVLVGGNQVWYRDALEGVRTDVCYTYRRGGF
jgi:hypothetical protein